MAIKSKLGHVCMAFLSPVVFADYNFEISSTLGMQSRPAEIQTTPGQQSAYSLYAFHRGYIDLKDAMGLSVAEFLQTEVTAIVDLCDQTAVEFYLSGKIIQEYAQAGARVNWSAPLNKSMVRLNAGLDAYLGMSSKATLEGANLDLYTNLAFDLMPSLEAVMQYKIPLYGYDEIAHQVSNQFYDYRLMPSLQVGVKFTLWPMDAFAAVEEVIVQEPVAISVSKYQPVEDEIEIFEFEDDEDDLMSVAVSEVEVPKGWFAQLIEFIAKLFKF